MKSQQEINSNRFEEEEKTAKGNIKKLSSLRSLQSDFDDNKQKLNDKISPNGSLILSNFRLNKDGIKFISETQSPERQKINAHKECMFLGSKHINNMRLNEFEIIQRLGQGKFGQVDKVLHVPTNEYYALKKIHFMTDEVQENFLKKELIALIDCDSPQIVKCFGAFYSKGEIYIILEYMDMGSLEDIITKAGKIVESIIMIIIHQVLKGLCYLHCEKKIIHRDIKPHNILINTKGEVKIADFGICSISNTSTHKWQTFIGTLGYMSPERISGEEYGMDSDIWSLGIMIIQCYTGGLPLNFNPKSMALIEFLTVAKKFDPEVYVQGWPCSKFLKQFVIDCLQQSIHKRSRSDELMVKQLIQFFKKQSKSIKLSSSLNMNSFKNWLERIFEQI